MNLPRLFANINKIGFGMCGGVERYEKAIATRRFRPKAAAADARCGVRLTLRHGAG
jgi:hypothetical protein